MIWLACLLTVLIETPLLALFGYRKKEDLILIAAVNVATNLTLNLLLGLVFAGGSSAWVYVLECIVVLAEYAFYSRAWGRSRRLFLQTLAANVLSYSIGLLVF